MSSPLTSGGPLFSLRCSVWVRHCLRLLVGVVDWCASRLARLICGRVILTESSPGSLLICNSLSIRLLVLLPLLSVRVRSGASYSWTLMVALTHRVCFLFFVKRTSDVVAPCLVVQCLGCFCVWVVSRFDGDRPMSPQFWKAQHLPLLPIANRFP